jgi:hypothetical protein
MIDLEKLDNLPKRIGIRKNILYTENYYKLYNRRNYKKKYWYVRDSILNNFIGKYFNDAYSEFKFKYPINDGEDTLLNFTCNIDNYNIRRSYFSNKYIIDDNGIIRLTETYKNWKKKNKAISITSEDFKAEWVHKESGIFKSYFTELYDDPSKSKYERKVIGYVLQYKPFSDIFNIWLFTRKLLPVNFWIYAKPEDFELKVIQGTKKVFTSKNDPRYKRLFKDSSKPKSKNKPKKMSEEQFRAILNAKKQLDKEKNDIIMIKKGFDPKTSFRYGQ